MSRKWLKYALGSILLTQLLTEVLPLCFIDSYVGFEYAYYIPMRLFAIGALPSLIMFYFCKSRVEKVMGLTLVISQCFWALREILSMMDGLDWLVLRVSSLDVCWVIFIILPLILSLITNAISRCYARGNCRLSLLLPRFSTSETDNLRNKDTNE